jgi:hypothetical protein
MASLNDELAIENFKELGPVEPLDIPAPGRYQPHRDMRLYPGANLSAERREALDDQAVDADDLTADDIAYCLSRLSTLTMYELIAQIEERWGKDAAKDVVFEWARKRGREAIKKWMAARGLDHITPESWAQYQDFRHLMSGPIHAHSFISYRESSDESEEDVVELNRTACFFHTGRPTGMDSYSQHVSHGMDLGYHEAFPEINFKFMYCMSEGTSTTGCKAHFRIQKDRRGGQRSAGKPKVAESAVRRTEQ